MGKIKKNLITHSCPCNYREIDTLRPGWRWGVNWYSLRGEHFNNIYKKRISFGPTLSLVGIYPSDLFAHERSTQVADDQLQHVYNNKKVETAQSSISRRLFN